MEIEKGSLAELVANECSRQLEEEQLITWFKQRLERTADARSFFIHFGLMGRKLPRIPIDPPANLVEQMRLRNAGFDPVKWTLDDFCRLALMLAVDPDENLEYVKTLVAAADMREQVIVYRSLSYFSNAGDFVMMAIDGIRTNMVAVFDAIALDNEYPFKYFEEAAWNQMVLKAIFMERPLYRIIGLDERRNNRLVQILHDFAHERWSAGRPVTPELWRLVEGFVDADIFADLQKVAQEDTPLARQAAAKILASTEFQPAKDWWQQADIKKTDVSWDSIGQTIQEKS